MKRTLSLLAFALMPAIASAQTAPAAGPPPDGMHGMQNRAQFMQMHMQARSQMLAALSPAHRALLANVVGTLATSATPDFTGAVRRLDSSLSPAESQSIVNIATQLHAQMRAAMQNAQQGNGAPPERNEPARTPDAGMALLHAAMMVGRPGPPH